MKEEAIGSLVSPEAALLLLACRPRVAGEEMTAVRSRLERAVQWKTLARLAESNAASALLFGAMRDAAPGGVTPWLARRLESAHRDNAARHLLFSRRLAEILDRFEANGISVIPFKGPLLSEKLYGDPGLRAYRDLDVLVAPDHVERARLCLIELGYRPEVNVPHPERFPPTRHGGELSFLTPGGIDVDLHWALAPSFYPQPFRIEEARRRLAVQEWQGRRVSTLDDADLLSYLCFHAAKHWWRRLSWLADLARLADGRPDLWDRAEERCAARGLRKPLLLAALLLAELLKVNTGHRLHGSALREPGVVASARWVTLRLASDAGCAEPTTGQIVRYTGNWIDSRLRRWKYISGLLVTPTTNEWEALRLPRPLWPCYYAYRPLRLLAGSLTAPPGGARR